LLGHKEEIVGLCDVCLTDLELVTVGFSALDCVLDRVLSVRFGIHHANDDVVQLICVEINDLYHVDKVLVLYVVDGKLAFLA
jgi:hypothetical protein